MLNGYSLYPLLHEKQTINSQLIPMINSLQNKKVNVYQNIYCSDAYKGLISFLLYIPQLSNERINSLPFFPNIHMACVYTVGHHEHLLTLVHSFYETPNSWPGDGLCIMSPLHV